MLMLLMQYSYLDKFMSGKLTTNVEGMLKT